MRGYKATNADLTCRGMQYEIGKTYTHEGKLNLCKSGLHFCKALPQTWQYYDREDSRFVEVEADGVVEGDDKCVARTLTIVREVPKAEVNRLYYGYGNGYGDGNGYGNGDGYGYGYGYGYGNGYGYGYGNGDGYGDGYGYGYGNGYGYGYGNGDGYGDRKIQSILSFK